MEFKIKTLKAILNNFGIVTPKNSLPILTNLLFTQDGTRNILRGTNLETYIEVELDTDVDEPIMVSKSMLKNLIANLPDNELITITKVENSIRFEGTAFDLVEEQAEATEDFPTPPDEITTGKPRFTTVFDRQQYNHLKSSLVCATTDELRKSMTALAIVIVGNKVCRSYTTDGHKLCKVTLDEERRERKAKPTCLTIGLNKDLFQYTLTGETDNVELNIYEENAELIYKDKRIVSRLVDDTFPDYESVIENYEHNIQVDSQAFAKAVKMVDLLPQGEPIHTHIDIKNEQIGIYATNSGFTINTQISAKGKEEFSFCIDAQKLRDVLNLFDSEAVMSFTAPLKAIQFHTADIFCLVMPMRNLDGNTAPKPQPKEETRKNELDNNEAPYGKEPKPKTNGKAKKVKAPKGKKAKTEVLPDNVECMTEKEFIASTVDDDMPF